MALSRREQQLAELRASATDTDAESSTDEWTVAARSLLLYVLRGFHGAEAVYVAPPVDGSTSSDQSRVVFAMAGEVESVLTQAQREGVFESSVKSTAVALWRTFLTGTH